MKSWIPSANSADTDFPIENLPYCTFGNPPHAGVAIGDQVLDVTEAFGVESVASLMAEPRPDLRREITSFLTNYAVGAERFLHPISAVELHLPCPIPDYTDFYASIHHATNVGRLFRPDNPLLPNYKWVPVAYHGRASSVVLSGTPIRRPWGQLVDNPAGPPVYAPCKNLDFELELGALLGPATKLGEPIPIDRAEDHLFGVCLLNDWSARDIQKWEYQPLGPFLAKNFATSISPWIVTREALEPFRRPVAPRDPEPLPHLGTATGAYAITLEVWLNSVMVSRSDFSTMYWTLSQMIAHHTSNGCNIRPGDLIGSGTVSGPDETSRGCLLEMTWRGADRFLKDGDEVILRGYCEAPGHRRIGLGECRGTITA